VNGGQVAAGSRGGPKCEGNLQFAAKAQNSHAFTLTICRILTISPSQFAAFSRFHPHNLPQNPDMWKTNIHIPCPDNNNPMQRICEEKARRILHWAFMKDCQ
jgi:hypothetical protein